MCKNILFYGKGVGLDMLKYIGKRILMIIPVIIGISLLIFTIMSLSSGSAAAIILGEGASKEDIAQLEEELGLDDPFIVQYFNYMKDALRGDFGRSYKSNAPVVDEITSRFPVTLKLAILGILIAVCLGIPLGIISAIKRYSIIDNITMLFTLLQTAMPNFWQGLMLMLIFAVYLDVLPATGVDSWLCFILPAITISTRTTAMVARMTRTTMMEVIDQDYIRTARAKGATEYRIIVKHALKNTLIPVITVVGTNFGNLLGGTVLVESVFAMPGIGSLLVTAIRTKDTPIVMAAVMFISICFSLVNLGVDLLYSVADPRIKSQYSAK